MIVVLDNLRSAHNVGSILRTCDALGIKTIYFCGITPGPEDIKVKKTSLGAEKNINHLYFRDTYSCLKELRKKRYRIIGLELSKKSVEISKVPKIKNMALIVGNEICGLSDETMSMCDLLIEIPMKGVKESLNVAVAFGIASYEICKT